MSNYFRQIYIEVDSFFKPCLFFRGSFELAELCKTPVEILSALTSLTCGCAVLRLPSGADPGEAAPPVCLLSGSWTICHDQSCASKGTLSCIVMQNLCHAKCCTNIVHAQSCTLNSTCSHGHAMAASVLMRTPMFARSWTHIGMHFQCNVVHK